MTTHQAVTCEDCRTHVRFLVAGFGGNLVVMLVAMAAKLRTDSQTMLLTYLQVRHENGHNIRDMDPDDVLAGIERLINA